MITRPPTGDCRTACTAAPAAREHLHQPGPHPRWHSGRHPVARGQHLDVRVRSATRSRGRSRRHAPAMSASVASRSPRSRAIGWPATGSRRDRGRIGARRCRRSRPPGRVSSATSETRPRPDRPAASPRSPDGRSGTSTPRHGVTTSSPAPVRPPRCTTRVTWSRSSRPNGTSARQQRRPSSWVEPAQPVRGRRPAAVAGQQRPGNAGAAPARPAAARGRARPVSPAPAW